MSLPQVSSAHQLLGRQLEDGWTVVELPPSTPGATGGMFSVCYIVEHTSGKRAFLKALDLSRAFRQPDPFRAIEALTKAFNFERQILEKCRDAKLDRIVIALAGGTCRVEGATDGGVAQYLIFELADGDLRAHADASQRFDVAWSLRALHHVATGLWQLHAHGIAHQDLKPSNVLVFPDEGSKLADLGRASYQGHIGPFEEINVAGDHTYAPPELLYGYRDPDWKKRRLGCDTYLLGSLAVFFFLGTGMTPILLNNLHPSHHWRTWKGSYQDVLPYMRHAFETAMVSVKNALHPDLHPDLTSAIRQLCDPDPSIRGHPRNRGLFGNPFSMERFMSLFNLLASSAEYRLICK